MDRRADIWAFGVVLFEMLTGKRLFDGATVSDTLAAVLRQDIELKALPEQTTPSIRRLLRRCLERDPKQRLRDIGEARIEIEPALTGAADEAAAPAIPRATAGWRRVLPWALLGSSLVAFTAALALWAPWRTTMPAAAVRVSAELGADASLVVDQGAAAVMSPDGRLLVFAPQKSAGGDTQLEQPAVCARRPQARRGHPGQGAGGPVGLRVGPRHADAPDLRSRQ